MTTTSQAQPQQKLSGEETLTELTKQTKSCSSCQAQAGFSQLKQTDSLLKLCSTRSMARADDKTNSHTLQGSTRAHSPQEVTRGYKGGHQPGSLADGEHETTLISKNVRRNKKKKDLFNGCHTPTTAQRGICITGLYFGLRTNARLHPLSSPYEDGMTGMEGTTEL